MDSYVLNASGVDTELVRRLYAHTTAPHGASLKSSRDRVRLFRLHGVLYDAGWTPSWIRSHLRNFDDDMLEGRELRYLAWAFAVMWFAIAQYRGENEEKPYADRTLFEYFANLGLTNKVAGRLSWVFTPLIDSCYTDDQLVIQGFEHVLDTLEIAGESIPSRPFRCRS